MGQSSIQKVIKQTIVHTLVIFGTMRLINSASLLVCRQRLSHLLHKPYGINYPLPFAHPTRFIRLKGHSNHIFILSSFSYACLIYCCLFIVYYALLFWCCVCGLYVMALYKCPVYVCMYVIHILLMHYHRYTVTSTEFWQKKQGRMSLNMFLSLLNLVLKETVCSLIPYIVPCVILCMYVVFMWYFAKLITVSTYIDVFPWDLDTMILG